MFCFAGVQWGGPFEDDYWSVISDFVGSFHPLLLHLPIGLWFAVCALMLASALVRDSVPRSIVYGMTILTFVSAILTFSAGFILYLGGGYGRASIALHMYSSLVFLISLAIFLISYGNANRPSFEWLSAGVTTAALLIAGHAGGVITHGDPFDRAPWRIFAERAKEEFKSVDAVASFRIFDSLVVPILEDKCMACHGIERAKGKLKMNTYAALLKGGSKGACLLPGDAAGSLMIQRINLPLDDTKRMPPADKEQLSLDEAAFLEWWVSAALPEEQSIESTSFPSEQQAYVQSIMGDSPLAIQARAAKARNKDLLLKYADFQTRYPGLLV
ncbi:MAG: c-type cytochrome domain-containing protein, partial [Verrucomicrobiota bacterium]|nr:c-type cytochrome domain-containing protein [Verrucomicrobiota bacterium]